MCECICALMRIMGVSGIAIPDGYKHNAKSVRA